jgi:hypothetical protein
MSNTTRRDFLRTSAVLAATLSGAASALHAHATEIPQAQPTAKTTPPKPGSDVQVPKMKFFGVDISRLVLGANPICGFAHYNNNFGAAMKDWYTPDRVCKVMHECNRFGINAFNYVHLDPAPKDWARFQAEGGKMHLIMQVIAQDDTVALAKTLKPLAMQRQGEVVDVAFREGKMDTVKDWCKKVRDLGVLVGVGTHKPEVIAYVEEKGWDVDFYAGCVYNRTRTVDEWKKVLNGEIMEMPHDIYLQSDPPRMYKVMRQTKKPCFAFKVLAAGRISDEGVEQAFRTAYESIKPIDAVYVGMFPLAKDEVRENAEIVHRILTKS